jgi:hypothetical protein
VRHLLLDGYFKIGGDRHPLLHRPFPKGDNFMKLEKHLKQIVIFYDPRSHEECSEELNKNNLIAKLHDLYAERHSGKN